jgi:hypothetical protein
MKNDKDSAFSQQDLIMNQQRQEFFNKLNESLEENKKYFLDILTRTDNSARLLQWIIDNNINPYSVFPGYLAGSYCSLEYFVSLYTSLTSHEKHAEVTYLKIKRKNSDGHEFELYPQVVLRHPTDSEFKEKVMRDLDLKEVDPFDGEVFVYEFEDLNSLDDYIETYNRVEKERIKLEEELDILLGRI